MCDILPWKSAELLNILLFINKQYLLEKMVCVYAINSINPTPTHFGPPCIFEFFFLVIHYICWINLLIIVLPDLTKVSLIFSTFMLDIIFYYLQALNEIHIFPDLTGI